jgi:NADH:ubiquinone reductase (H+-translocating)
MGSHGAQRCDKWAGFGVFAAAKALSGQEVEVTLVDQLNLHTFLPLLYEVATAGLDPGDVAYPVRAVIGRTHPISAFAAERSQEPCSRNE